MGRVAASGAVGAAFGAATSIVNWVSTPASAGGGGIADTVWGSMLRVVSHILDAGWAWAAVAVLAGWVAGTIMWGSIAGLLSLLAATAGYDLVDSMHFLVPFGTYWGDMPLWGAVSLLLGPILGAVGACVRTPGVMGLSASLVVPTGAALQMMVLPPQGGLIAERQVEAAWARGIVLVAAALAAVYVIARYALSRHQAAGAPQ